MTATEFENKPAWIGGCKITPCEEKATLCKFCGWSYCQEHGKEHIENWDLYHAPEDDDYE